MMRFVNTCEPPRHAHHLPMFTNAEKVNNGRLQLKKYNQILKQTSSLFSPLPSSVSSHFCKSSPLDCPLKMNTPCLDLCLVLGCYLSS